MTLAPEIALRRHIQTFLAGHTVLGAVLDRVDDPAARPSSGRQLSVSIAEARDWSGGGFTGREVQLVLSLQDDARDDEQLGEALGVIDQVLDQVPSEMPGWCIVNLQPLVRRILRGSDARWRTMGRYRIRMVAQLTS
ncbi:tail completion protein gp17 [Parasphingorhabdus sp. DH2-15]|uniref:tail completion protein gp17 n=1 Tax=Parasphingorhabdus sp. DH2-15 TaxID=3444112 RepID=UPI003F6891E9